MQVLPILLCLVGSNSTFALRCLDEWSLCLVSIKYKEYSGSFHHFTTMPIKSLFSLPCPHMQPEQLNDTPFGEFLVEPSRRVLWLVKYKWEGKEKKGRVIREEIHRPSAELGPGGLLKTRWHENLA